VNFLGHEMAIVRLIDQRGRGAVLNSIAAHDRIVFVVDGRAGMGQDNPVAVLQITDRVRERSECDGIRPQIHFPLAVADRERRPIACADQKIVFTRKDESQRKRAAKLRQRGLDRVSWLQTFAEVIINQSQHDLGVGFGGEDRPLALEVLA
jgi:hypothetical protein